MVLFSASFIVWVSRKTKAYTWKFKFNGHKIDSKKIPLLLFPSHHSLKFMQLNFSQTKFAMLGFCNVNNDTGYHPFAMSISITKVKKLQYQEQLNINKICIISTPISISTSVMVMNVKLRVRFRLDTQTAYKCFVCQ